MPTVQDWWYYAIKGFAYQFDKALNTVLSQSNLHEEVHIEYIQDIDTESEVLQIKYKETQEYSDSKVREPILQLIEEYKTNPDKNYRLYCHFSDKSDSQTQLTLVELDTILTPINSRAWSSKSLAINTRIGLIDTTTREWFIRNFYLHFSPTFQAQFDSTVVKICRFFGVDNDLAMVYYGVLVDFLQKVVFFNANPPDRKITLGKLKSHVENGKKLIFNHAFREYKWDEKFISYLKSKKPTLNTKKHNIYVLGPIPNTSTYTLNDFILDYVKKYNHRATYDIFPVTFVIDDSQIENVKKSFIRANIRYNDGYESIEFSKYLFLDKPLVNRRTMPWGRVSETINKMSFECYLISKTSIQSICEALLNIDNVIYINADEIPNLISVKEQHYTELSINEVKEIFIN